MADADERSKMYKNVAKGEVSHFGIEEFIYFVDSLGRF